MAGWPAQTLAVLALFATGIAARASDHAPAVVLMKLRAEGPSAVTTCAEDAWRSGRTLSGATADGSDSLDRLQQELGVREVRAVFRRPDGSSFASQRRRLLERLRARRARAAAAPAQAELPDLSHVYRLRLASGVDAADAAARYGADPHVEWAQPDYRMQADFLPDDPYFHSSGSWGQPYADLWGLARIRAPEAWEYTRGEGAVVAVVDTGVDPLHPDIAPNLWVNPGEDLDGDGSAEAWERNGVDDDGNGFVDDQIGFDFHNSFDGDGDGDFGGPSDTSDADPTDDHGHGTHVAGIVAAAGSNGQGIIGVAPRARIMALKGLGDSGSGLSSVLARALVYAAENGADVINTSWSCSSRCPVHPLVDEAVALAHALGSVVVDSAGNGADDVVFYSPEKLRETLVVAATSEDDSRAAFSNLGFLVDLAAPGAGLERPGVLAASDAILSLLASGAPESWSTRVRVGDAYVRKRGTSASTPYVAGVVALVRSLHPDATPEAIRALLRASARDLGAPGHDRLFGAGIVDALAAVTRSAPRVRGVLAEPGPGAIVNARPGRVEVLGSADGEDFSSYALAFGHGMDPSDWHEVPPASAAPVTDALLGVLDVDALRDGAYVLRLDVISRSGELVREFLPFSLERNRPFPISSGGLPALAPDLSGELAVWEVASEDPTVSRDVVARDLRGGPEIPIALGPGEQRFPRVSGRRIAFLDRGREAGGEIATCVVHPRAGRCDAQHVATGPAQRSGPVVSGDRIFWIERDASGTSPRLCDLHRGAACSPQPVAVRPQRPFELDVSGSRLVWREQQPTFSVWTCLLDPKSLACPAQLVNDDLPFQQTPAASGELFAFGQFHSFPGVGFAYQVHVCRLDPASGACPALAVGAPTLSAPLPDVSADTVVWSASQGDEAPAIHFCEYDPVTHSCPAQRLTGSAAGQTAPVIDGRRVIFEDARDGASRIRGFDLPDLAVRGARQLREGETLQIEISGRGPSREPLVFGAELAGGAPVESLGMRLRPRGDGSAQLTWRPGAGSAGIYTVQLRGTTAGHLVTRETLEIVVSEGDPGRR